MNLKTLTLGLILLATPSFIEAAEVTLRSGFLYLAGDSTMHAFTSTATVLTLDAAMEDKGGALKSLTLSLPVNGLKSDSGQLDKNLYKALNEKAAPEIRFEMKSYEAAGETATVKGMLSIAGVAREEAVTGAVTREAGALRVTGAKELKMSDFGVKPPTMFLGAIKVKDQVVIHFDLVLAAKEK